MEDKEKNTQIPVIRLDRQLKYEGNILKIYEDKVLANGHEARWDFIHHDGAAAVLPVADDGKILMVRQYRNALDRYTLEIPAGKLDAPGSPRWSARSGSWRRRQDTGWNHRRTWSTL